MRRLTKDIILLLRTGMVFGSHSQRPFGDVTAWVEKDGKPTEDTPTHSGFIVLLGNEVMVAEVQPKGFKLDSIEKYFGKKEWIVSVHEPILDKDHQDALVAEIYRRLRKDRDRPYDLAGAIASAPFAMKLLWWVAPWIVQKDWKQFCSEVLAQVLAKVNLTVPSERPNPLVLSQWMDSHPTEYRTVV